MKQLILSALIASFSLAGVSAQTVREVRIGDNLNYGITYHLPTTVVVTTVNATCKRVEAGPYAIYAEKYLGLTDVALSDQTLWQVESLDMTIKGRPDSANTYHIDFSPKAALPSFYLNEEGCLLGINHRVEEEVVSEPLAEAPKTQIVYKPTDVMTPEILRAGSKAKQAELIAEEIFSIRESRSELIRGEADNTPNDGLQLQLMLDNLAAQERALLSLFVGNTTVTREARSYEYCPSVEVPSEMLFRFSKELGFCEVDDLAGAPYYINVAVTTDNRLAEPLDPKARQKVQTGIAYCKPGKAQISVSTIGHELASHEFPIAQFGHVERLPQAQFTNKKMPYAATFNAITGAMYLFEAAN